MHHPFHRSLLLLSVFVQALFPGVPELLGAPGTLSIEEVTRKTLAANPGVAIARARWQMAVQRIPQEAAWEDPKLNVRSLLGRFAQVPANGFTDQMVELEQTVPISGKNRSRERAATAEAVAVFEDLREQELDIVVKARSAFLQLANDYELLGLNQAEASSVAQAVENSRINFEVGKESQVSLLTAEIEEQKLKENRQDLEQKRSLDETALKVLMNVDVFTPLGRPQLTVKKPLTFEPQQLRARILLNNPQVLQAKAQLAAAKSRSQLARRAWIPDPTVSIQADHYNAGSQIASEFSGGVSISLPWFNGKKYQAGAKEALEQVAAANTALQASQNEALGKLKNQLQKLQTLHQQSDLYEKALLPRARQIISANQSDYQAGKTSLQTVLLSIRNQWELEASYRQQITNYQIAQAELESLLGASLGFFGTSIGKTIK